MAHPTRPQFEPELAGVLAAIYEQRAGGPHIRPDRIAEIRAEAGYSMSDEEIRRNGAIEFEERPIPGPAGEPDISVLICRPRGSISPAPCIYHIHGGAMVCCDSRTGLSGVLDWALEFGAVVVSVTYRLAPEHPDPALVEDCYAGLTWTAENAAELGIDPKRILVAGASAGGGLSAAMALMTRDRGGPALVGQLLMCPMLDDRSQTPSSTMLHNEGNFDHRSNQTGWEALLGERCGGPDVSSYAAPARATDLSDLAPAFIDVGSVETFRDEAIDYATRIWQAGGDAELHVWSGGFHAFDILAPNAVLSKLAVKRRSDWIRRVLPS